jgi:hypothetical protein
VIAKVKTMCSMVEPWPDSMTDEMSFCIFAGSKSPSTARLKIDSGASSE